MQGEFTWLLSLPWPARLLLPVREPMLSLQPVQACRPWSSITIMRSTRIALYPSAILIKRHSGKVGMQGITAAHMLSSLAQLSCCRRLGWSTIAWPRCTPLQLQHPSVQLLRLHPRLGQTPGQTQSLLQGRARLMLAHHHCLQQLTPQCLPLCQLRCRRQWWRPLGRWLAAARHSLALLPPAPVH